MKNVAEPEWYELEARSAAKELWALPRWEGQGELGSWLLPDGREVFDLIATGDIDDLCFLIWFEPYQSYPRAGDLIWTGSEIKLASQRFVDVLTSIGATGFQSYDADQRSKKSESIPASSGWA